MPPGYIYGIRVEFVRSGDPIVKFGHCADITARMRLYPDSAVLLFCIYSSTPEATEAQLLSQLTMLFVHRLDLGRDFFEGNPEAMVAFATSFVATREIASAAPIQPSQMVLEYEGVSSATQAWGKKQGGFL